MKINKANDITALRLAPAGASMTAAVEPHHDWIESILGCRMDEVVALELDAPPVGLLAAVDLLAGAELEQRSGVLAQTLRRFVCRWQLPPGQHLRLRLTLGREHDSPVSNPRLTWMPHWLDTPLAVWFEGLQSPVVTVNAPVVSFNNSDQTWLRWVLVNRTRAGEALNVLKDLTVLAHKHFTADGNKITVVNGKDIVLAAGGYNWDDLVLDTEIIRSTRNDFEAFLAREAWFRARHLPYRRGYLFHGPPGNGKTSVVRILASHPAVDPVMVQMQEEGLPADALSAAYELAADHPPALLILEDLDRLCGANQDEARSILQKLLSALDGLASREGVVVVATANNISELDHALVRRPGRFDRLVRFAPPGSDLRLAYLERLCGESISREDLLDAAARSERMSFAQIKECYVQAGQGAFLRGGDIRAADLLEAINSVHRQTLSSSRRANGRSVGFEPPPQGMTCPPAAD